jgi:CheY-like chemotaxis protein
MVARSPTEFIFEPQELAEQLRQASHQGAETGYWLLQLPAVAPATAEVSWYLALLQGKVVYAGTQPLSWTALLEILNRYVSRLRDSLSQPLLQSLETNTVELLAAPLANRLSRLEQLVQLEHSDTVKAVKRSILTSLDSFLFDRGGRASFRPDYQLTVQSPIAGFDLEELLWEAQARRLQWQQVRHQITSMSLVPLLNRAAIEQSGLEANQVVLLRKLTKRRKSLNAIACELGRDPLEVASTFASLAKRGLVQFAGSEQAIAERQDTMPPQELVEALPPEIFIVDDSPILLKQFCSLVTRWGYRVTASSNPLTAVREMAARTPAIIFLDIHMPGASGFELIKQIRRQPLLAATPMVLLTAEKSIANQWRAQWASCAFLAKPRTVEEVREFQVDLRLLLEAQIPAPIDAAFA